MARGILTYIVLTTLVAFLATAEEMGSKMYTLSAQIGSRCRSPCSNCPNITASPGRGNMMVTSTGGLGSSISGFTLTEMKTGIWTGSGSMSGTTSVTVQLTLLSSKLGSVFLRGTGSFTGTLLTVRLGGSAGAAGCVSVDMALRAN